MWFKHNLLHLLLIVSLALLPALGSVAAASGHHDHHVELCPDCDHVPIPAPAVGDSECCQSIAGTCGSPLCALSPQRPALQASDLSGPAGWRIIPASFRTRLSFSIYRPPIA